MASDISNSIEPSTLQDLTVAAICSKLACTICEEVGGRLKLREGLTLPLSIASKILNYLIKSLDVDPMQDQSKSDQLFKYCNLFTDATKCKLKKIVVQRAPITDDVVEVLTDLAEAHPIFEIDLSDSSDMKADYRPDSAPYNHSIFLLGFLIDTCGATLKRLTMTNTFLANSIQQISSLSGKKATVLGQDQYLASTATIVDIPTLISRSDAPKLENLDIAGSFTAWFTGIDPNDPPALHSLNISGYSDKRMNSAMKEIVKNIAYGEPDYKRPERMPATIAYPKSERKMYKYKFFKRFGNNQDAVEKFVRLCQVQKYVVEDNKLEADYELPPPGNFVLYNMNLLSMKDTLLHLSLFGTYLSVSDFENTIFQLKKLVSIDLGWAERQTHKISNHRPQAITIWQILDSFPCLRSLDISGTSWAQVLYEEAENGNNGKVLKMDRERKPLEFLGLWGTSASKLKNIHLLADRISGEQTLDQLVSCLEMYMHTKKIVSEVLSKMTEKLQDDSYERPFYLLDLLIRCVKRNRFNTTMMFDCVSCIYFQLQACIERLNPFQKRDLTDTAMILMENNMTEGYIQSSLLRNAMILLASFQLPQDVLYDFDHIVSLSLEILREHKDVQDVGVTAANLCNILVASVELDVKSFVRKHEYIETMIDLIEDRLRTKTGDELLDCVWSALWNVTDETPANSEDVIEKGVLELFKKCYYEFPGRNELHRNMAGLLGNISEVDYLRVHLAKDDLINIYCALALVPDSGVEVGYNASGILSNLLVDDSDILKNVDKKMLRDKIHESVLSWDIDVARNINYRTFKPLLALLTCPTEPEAHLWVMWALHNLCERESKYVDMVIKEGGVEMIRGLQNTTGDEHLKRMASDVVEKCDQKHVATL